MPRKKGKLTKGQPIGLRSASGRLRDRTPKRVEPSEGIVRRKASLGVPANDTNTCDALGRCYIAGFLGRGDREERARSLLAAGRKIASQYWRVYGFATPDSLARFQPGNASVPMDPALEKIREDALNVALEMVRARGHQVYTAFQQLVVDMNPDQGPRWLDAMIWAEKHGKPIGERDAHMMKLALEGLEAVT